MQSLQLASYKNNYLYQIQVNLADIQVWAYNFMMKRIPRGFNIFTREINVMLCYVMLCYKYDVMFLFLFHILGLHFPEAIKQQQ